MIENLIWSYSFLSTFERCARQAQARYITKELPYSESPEMAYGNKVHQFMEDRIKGAIREVPTEFAYLEKYIKKVQELSSLAFAEYQIGVRRDWSSTEFFARDCWGRGKLDFCAIDGNFAIIFDWKTGKVREDPYELEIQSLLLKCKHPYLEEIKGCYVWFKQDKFGQLYDLSSTDQTKKHVKEIMRQVSLENWRASKNPLCPWCQVEQCPFFKETRKK